MGKIKGTHRCQGSIKGELCKIYHQWEGIILQSLKGGIRRLILLWHEQKSSDPYFPHRGKFSLSPFLGAEQISPRHHLSCYQRCTEYSGSHALYISTWWGKVGTVHGLNYYSNNFKTVCFQIVTLYWTPRRDQHVNFSLYYTWLIQQTGNENTQIHNIEVILIKHQILMTNSPSTVLYLEGRIDN